jgi:general secretion pathway protein J
MNSHNKKGFTLLEILIALFIFTIIAGIMVSVLHNMLNHQTRLEKHAAKLSRLQIAMLLLSRDIEQVIDRPVTNAKNILEASLIGTPDILTFTHTGLANPMGQLTRSTLQRVQYYRVKNNLIRLTWLVLDQTQKTLPDSRRLLSGVTSVRFEYLDMQNQWADRWPPPSQKTAGLPKAVRVSLTLDQWGTINQLYFLPEQTFANPH